MELIVSTVVVPWAGSVIGLAFAMAMIAALVAVVYSAGLYYSVPRWIVKFLEQKAMRRIP
jgi:hypothetical protein